MKVAGENREVLSWENYIPDTRENFFCISCIDVIFRNIFYFHWVKRMDVFDRQILMLLQQDATMALKDLAEAVSLSVTPCWKRVKKLEEAGYIRGRVALLDADKLDLGLSVFVQLKTQRHDSRWLAQFAETVTAFDEVVEFYRMSGEWDYMLRVVVADITAFDRFYKKLITSTEGLSDITSSFAMEQIKYTTALPLGK